MCCTVDAKRSIQWRQLTFLSEIVIPQADEEMATSLSELIHFPGRRHCFEIRSLPAFCFLLRVASKNGDTARVVLDYAILVCISRWKSNSVMSLGYGGTRQTAGTAGGRLKLSATSSVVAGDPNNELSLWYDRLRDAW